MWAACTSLRPLWPSFGPLADRLGPLADRFGALLHQEVSMGILSIYTVLSLPKYHKVWSACRKRPSADANAENQNILISLRSTCVGPAFASRLRLRRPLISHRKRSTLERRRWKRAKRWFELALTFSSFSASLNFSADALNACSARRLATRVCVCA